MNSPPGKTTGGTPEQRFEYAVMEAGRRGREAAEAAGARCAAAGDTPTASQRDNVAYLAAHAEWAAGVAAAVTEFARELGATALPVSSCTGDPASPYHQGRSDGAGFLIPDILQHRGGYDDGQWLEYVAGYAEGAQLHAEEASSIGRQPGGRGGRLACAVRRAVRQLPRRMRGR